MIDESATFNLNEGEGLCKLTSQSAGVMVPQNPRKDSSPTARRTMYCGVVATTHRSLDLAVGADALANLAKGELAPFDERVD